MCNNCGYIVCDCDPQVEADSSVQKRFEQADYDPGGEPYLSIQDADEADLDDDFYDLDDQGDKYDSEGNVVWSAAYEGSFVPLKCEGCDCTFMGMPDHGYCHTCADIRERGGELPNNY